MRQIDTGRAERITRRLVASALVVAWILAALPSGGCGSGWTSIPPDTIANQSLAPGEMVRLTFQDGRIFDFRVERVEPPYVWGERFVGERMHTRPMRIDLGQVSRIEIKRSG